MSEQRAEAVEADEAPGECCGGAAPVDDDLLRRDVELLGALGNDTRYELLRRIAGTDGGVCVCELEAAVGVSQSAVSQALSRLFGAGRVTRRKEGSWSYYETTETAEALLDALDDVREGAT